MTIEIRLLWFAAVMWTVLEIGIASVLGDGVSRAVSHSISYLGLALWAHVHARWIA